MRRNAHLLLVGLVIVLGAALRLYHLSFVPTELIVDELDLYNSAHSIVTTGHDIDGGLRPFLYCSLTRNPPIYAFAGYASSLVLGKSPFGLRFPAVLFGLASILSLYGITRELTRRRDIALLAALVMAVAPIFIQFSRVAWEPSSELPFLLGGLYIVIRTFRRADDAGDGRLSFRGLAWGAALLGLTSYTYMAGWFYAIVLGGGLAALYLWNHRTRDASLKGLGAIAIWFAISAPALWMWFFDFHTTQRTDRISTFSHGITFDALRAFASNYLAHFRWSYLVTTGDPLPGQTWRYLDGFGALYWWVIPLAVVGLAVLYRYVRSNWGLAWIWLWLAAYPLGGALTNEGAPNAPRTLAGAPVFCLLAAVGLTLALDLAKSLRRPRAARTATFVVRAFFGVSLAISVAYFSAYYFTSYVKANSNAWDSGTTNLFATILAHQSAYDRVCFAVQQAWYGTDTYVRYYLDGSRLHAISRTDDPDCAKRGTMFATDVHHMIGGPGLVPIDTVVDVSGSTFAMVYGRPR